jgi:tetratricopeptide (TPR) repeat protein
MDYLEYAYLQSARVQQAKAVLEQMHSLPALTGLTLTGDYAIASIPARLAVELGNWTEASGLSVRDEGTPWTQAITWTAIGVGSARSGNLERATLAERTLASLRDATAKQDNAYWSSQVEVQRREVAGWIAQSSGNSSEAIAQLRSAAELEETMDKNAVTPGAVTPAREMLAQALFLQNHPQDALAEYQAVLKVAPNRFNALFGAAIAAEAAGNAQTAYEFFSKLTQIAAGDERPELATARQKIVVPPQKAAL